MGFKIVIVAAAGTLLCAYVAMADKAPSRDSLHGVWELSGGEADGEILSQAELKDGRLVIEGDHYTFSMANTGTLRGTQKLGTSKGLLTIDITDESGAHKDELCLGIYEVEGDKFRVVFASPGGDRPSKFETAPNSGQWMHIWKRVKG